MASRFPTRPDAAPIEARLLTATLFVGCLPHSILRRRGLSDTLASARDAIAQVYAHPG